MSLSCLTVPDAEDRAVVIRHPNVEPRPLPAPQGPAYVARGGIEMECGVVGVQERSEALGDLPRYAIAKPTSVTFVQERAKSMAIRAWAPWVRFSGATPSRNSLREPFSHT